MGAGSSDAGIRCPAHYRTGPQTGALVVHKGTWQLTVVDHSGGPRGSSHSEPGDRRETLRQQFKGRGFSSEDENPQRCFVASITCSQCDQRGMLGPFPSDRPPADDRPCLRVSMPLRGRRASRARGMQTCHCSVATGMWRRLTVAAPTWGWNVGGRVLSLPVSWIQFGTCPGLPDG